MSNSYAVTRFCGEFDTEADYTDPFVIELIEVMFSLEGIGLLGFESTIQRDYPVVFSSLYIMTLLGLLLGIISDLTYTWVDPRIDFEAR